MLFVLTLTLGVSRGANSEQELAPVANASRRFGFVEWGEGERGGEAATWYTVNGRRINFISDATPEAAMSHYDCYTTSEVFLAACDWLSNIVLELIGSRLDMVDGQKEVLMFNPAFNYFGFILRKRAFAIHHHRPSRNNAQPCMHILHRFYV